MAVFYQAASDTGLETSRLVLEPLAVHHATKLFQSFQSAKLRFIDRPTSVEELENKYRRFATHGPGDGSQVWLNWVAREKATSGYVGWFQATIFDGGSTGLAWVVFPENWRQGYAAEAVRALMPHLTEIYAPNFFFAEMNVENESSIALAEKLGFQRVERLNDDEFRYEIRAARDLLSHRGK